MLGHWRIGLESNWTGDRFSNRFSADLSMTNIDIDIEQAGIKQTEKQAATRQANTGQNRRRQAIGLGVISLTGFSMTIALPVWAAPQMAQPTRQLAQQTRQQEVLTKAEVYRLQNNVQLLPRNQSARPARLQDELVPLDALRTAASSLAELLFNEGSITRVDQSTTFYFRQGLRRFQLSNRVAMTETIFVLENGTALLMSPPNSSGTQVETPEGIISIVAAAETSNVGSSDGSTSETGSPETGSPETESPDGVAAANLLTPPDRSTVAMVTHDSAGGTTQVFALTDGNISVSDRAGTAIVPLMGGQTVAIANGQVGAVQEFDLAAFYSSVPLAAGLGPNQEAIVLQQPIPLQTTLNAVRIETLAAVVRQSREWAGFSRTFLRDALSGSDSDFSGQRGASNVIVIDPVVTPGTFTRTGENTAVFTDADQNRVPIRIDFDSGRISINGNSGITNNAGLSGNNAVGTVVQDNGRVVRIEVFDVGGNEPSVGESFRGRLTTGIAPDR
jgi:hypothetical protein